ncbi:MAG: hypothetical protein RPR28_04005 [Cycloclasticus sp.]
MAKIAGSQFSLEMGFSRDEFIRSLEKQTSLKYNRQGNHIQLYFSNKTVLLTLGEQRFRQIASLRLPSLRVDFDFSALSELEQEQLLQQFLLKFNRGGG